MRLFAYLFFLLMPMISWAQSLSLFDVDASNFPTIRAKFYAFDKDGNQITNISPSDFDLKENGKSRIITNVSCPAPQPPKALSSVLTIDVSGSMDWGPGSVVNIELAKAAARSWIKALPLGRSECAITTFDHMNYLNQDFTKDLSKLLKAIDPLTANGGTDYDAALIDAMAGGLLISKNGKYQKVIVFLTDGQASEPNKGLIIKEANEQNCVIYAVTLGMKAPQSIKDIALMTGGEVFENVTTIEEAENVYRKILETAQGGEPCEIEWESNKTCDLEETSISLFSNLINKHAQGNYRIPSSEIASLDISPPSYRFQAPKVGDSVTHNITITAINSSFEITNISSSNPLFDITPNNFFINDGESVILSLSYKGIDSVSDFCIFTFENDLCNKSFYSSVGYKRKKPKIPTLKLVHPNGGERFVVGSDTLVSWQGVTKDEIVRLDYSIDNGKTWATLAESSSDLQHKWSKIPKPESNTCLVRVSQGEFPINYDPSNPSPEIEWEKSYGGTNNDRAIAVIELKDGLYSIIGNTNSRNGDIVDSLTKGGTDISVIKVNPFDGDVIWSNNYGGSYNEEVKKAILSKDGSLILLAYSESINGDVTNNKGSGDIWLLKVNPNDGNIIWQKTLGGSNKDIPNSIFESKDGTIVVSGFTYSIDGDVADKSGGKVWILKLSSTDGSITWQKNYKFDNIEESFGFIETSDGAFVISATLIPMEDDTTGNKGRGDILVSKFNPNTSISIWERVYGGSYPEVSKSIIETSDGSYVILGTTESSNGDLNINKGGGDVWILKVNSKDGIIIWQNTVGGSFYDVCDNIIETYDSSYLLSGKSSSKDGDIARNQGSEDALLIKINPVNGSINWIKAIGGSQIDAANYLTETIDGSLLLAGYTSSRNGDVKVNKGFNDFWVVKLNEVFVYQSDISDNLFSIVEPRPISKNVNMGECLVNEIKDSLVTRFVLNNGLHKFNVINISFRGPDASSFSLISGFPIFTLNSGNSKNVEFRFVPNRIGVHNAEIVIETQSETLVQTITGIGVSQNLFISDKIIDFGEVIIGKSKDTINTKTITNVGTTPITISSSKHNFPNLKDFSTIAGGGNFTLNPNETKLMDLRFSPSDNGRTSGTLEFHYNGVGSPAVILLFGEGVTKNPKIQSSITSFDDLICENESISNIEIKNDGGNDLIINSLNIAGKNNLDFIVNHSLPITIKPDSVYSLLITFRPQTTGNKIAELEIKSNADPDSLLKIDLFARKDDISLSSINEIDLGILCPNESKDFDFQIENLGTIETIAKLTEDSDIKLSNTKIRINNGKEETVQGQFAGIAQEGSFNRTLTITDTCGNVQSINVKGIIESPKLQAKDLEINSLVGKSKIEKIKIENTSARDVIITEINGLSQPFSIVGNPFPFEILSNSSKEIEVEFNPIDQNPITQNVEIIGEPCSIIKNLSIKGLAFVAGLSISTMNIEAYPGEEIEVPIILNSSENLTLAGVNSINAELIFNPTLLAPIGYQVENIDNKSAKIKIEDVPISSNIGSTLTNIKFKVGLGNAESCDLTLDNAETIGGTADISLINGKFTLLGICEEGGSRLINPSKITKLMQISPNPSDGNVDVELNLVEKGITTLKVFSVSGDVIKEMMISNQSGNINLELDTKNYGNGLYFIHLQTPTVNKIEKLILFR